MVYEVPNQFLFELHHPRPRFKNNIENVLIYVATAVAIQETEVAELFDAQLFESISLFPGNEDKTDKTIDNWRTEISSLLGLVQETDDSKKMPSKRATELANSQDLIAFFKAFLYFFQYPGHHLKPKDIVDALLVGVKFHPARAILELLSYEESEDSYLTKAEATHCMFNDLRVTRDSRSAKYTWELIKLNRTRGVEYDTEGDVIRYAGDILDYMVLGNLLYQDENQKYFLNRREHVAINTFLTSQNFFVYSGNIPSEVNQYRKGWFDYVNQDVPNEIAQTDLTILTPAFNTTVEVVAQVSTINTKEIGDKGELLILSHEKARLRIAGEQELSRRVQLLPTPEGHGYDIKSFEVTRHPKYIEVKTTISKNPITFNSFHLTTNEWLTAESSGRAYCVYRLMISDDGNKLYVMRDPVRLYKSDLIIMTPRDGADIRFHPEQCSDCGNFEELLNETN